MRHTFIRWKGQGLTAHHAPHCEFTAMLLLGEEGSNINVNNSGATQPAGKLLQGNPIGSITLWIHIACVPFFEFLPIFNLQGVLAFHQLRSHGHFAQSFVLQTALLNMFAACMMMAIVKKLLLV